MATEDSTSKFAKDERGNVYGRLTVIRRDGMSRTREAQWLCKCECGNTTTVTGHALRRGTTKACGCLAKKSNGLTNSAEHRCWAMMKNRCYNPKYSLYYRYGGRGISVCDRWLNSFLAFYEDVGVRPSTKHSIDRINNEGNYEPGNVRWATRLEQSRNRSHVKMLSHNGETKHIADWASEYGLNPNTIRSRVRAGWTVEAALTTPVKQ